MSRYYRNYNYWNYSGRRYYKRWYRSNSNDDIFSAVFVLPALIIFSFLAKYMSDIQNFFVKYWLSILNYIVVIFVIVGIFYFVISVIKKISNSSYRMSSTMIPTKSSISNKCCLSYSDNMIKTPTIAPKVSVPNEYNVIPKANVSSEPRKPHVSNIFNDPRELYRFSIPNQPIIVSKESVSNEPTIVPKVSVPNYDEQNLSKYIFSESNKNTENIRDINEFLKKSFPSVIDGKNIYWLNWYLRWLHSKIVEDLIELTFELDWFQIIERSKWIWKPWFRKAKKDWGIDLICKKDGKKTFVQVKAKVTDLVTDDVIRNLHGSTTNKRKDWDSVIVITTTLFSSQAKKTALEDSIRLIDYNELNKKIDSLYKNESYRKTLQYFFINNYYPKEDKYLKTNRECPNCGAPLKFRQNHWKTCYWCTAFCGHLEYLN